MFFAVDKTERKRADFYASFVPLKNRLLLPFFTPPRNVFHQVKKTCAIGDTVL